VGEDRDSDGQCLFSDEIVTLLDGEGVEFTLSVPFERFVALKGMIEQRKRWRCFDETWSILRRIGSPRVGAADIGFLF